MSDYIQDLNAKLQAARTRVRKGRELKALQDTAPTLFEIIDGEISLAINRAFAEQPLPYEQYLSAHGEMRGIKRIRDLITTKELEAPGASQEVVAIEKQIKQFEDDKKQ